MAQILVRYHGFIETDINPARTSPYWESAGSALSAFVAFAKDFQERQKVGQKLVSHSGDKDHIIAVWEIP